MNMPAEAFRAYQVNQVQTASREKLVVMLYDGIIRFLGQAEAAWAASDVVGTHNSLIRAQDIIVELMSTLNREAGGQIAENLYLLYDYMKFRLVEANIKKDMAPIAEVKHLVTELRGAWAEISRQGMGVVGPKPGQA